MKALWIICLGIALGGCAVVPEQTMSVTSLPAIHSASYGFTAVRDERPQEIVGHENHQAVLDGAS